MNLRTAQETLKLYFGYDSFRPMQAEIIEAVYAGRDALVLMPTGGGKSVCFQIPAITLPGACVVVSPLISLMKDQVEGLREAGVRAAYLNSSIDAGTAQQVEDAFFKGQLDLLYVSPEKLLSADFMPLLRSATINLFAIDEAHCISSWGHDFRPEYTQLRFLRREFPNIPIIALTATADKVTRRDIAQQLTLSHPAVFVASFDRPNISLEVRPGQKRVEQILDFLKTRRHQSGIVYCLSRKGAEDLAARLSQRGFPAMPYHAGLTDRQRAKTQEDFINDKTPIVCATVAFGMGIDKSNVRWVIHYNLPKNMEGYYQEIGRSGRDGTTAETLLFYSYQDVAVLEDILRQGASDQVELQLSKLERMKQYAEALTCRRRILLSYFGEHLGENCGNCDVCRNPPQYFDGTVLAQKALSAIARLNEAVPAGIVAEVLRGSGRRDIIERGYDRIKTYGAGRDLPQNEWLYYIQQLVHLGYAEPAAEEHYALKLTANGRKVLFEDEKVQFARFVSLKERKAAEKVQAKKQEPQGQRRRVRDELFEVLRKLRQQVALKQGVPPYVVFSDATLEEMAAMRPRNRDEFRSISGVGEMKLERYGNDFLEAIRSF
jgi:ATP-dependent DNA helicase RecQ